jgi:hypothetical protein
VGRARRTAAKAHAREPNRERQKVGPRNTTSVQEQLSHLGDRAYAGSFEGVFGDNRRVLGKEDVIIYARLGLMYKFDYASD